jgi:hypothetical protein
MSRSKRRSPVHGVTKARSEKLFKQTTNRTLRQKQKKALQVDPETAVLPVRGREATDIWDSAKEGKNRFDLREVPRFLRK